MSKNVNTLVLTLNREMSIILEILPPLTLI